MAETVAGKVVIVTGAGGGIGRAICRDFCGMGAKVVAFYRKPSEFRTLKEEALVEGEFFGLKVDITRQEEIKGALTRIDREHGTVDVLINCAGVGSFGPIDSITDSQWKEMVDVNLTGTFLMTREVVRVMKERGGGVIINIASITGLKGYPKCSAYGATKAGIVGLTRNLAEELIPYGIRVAVVCPGSVDTPFQDNIPKLIPREKMIKPEDVANTALFVACLPPRVVLDEIVIRPRAAT